MFKVRAFFTTTVICESWRLAFYPHRETHAWQYLFTWRGGLGPHQMSLTPPLFIEVSVQNQECEWSCIYPWDRITTMRNTKWRNVSLYV